MSKIVLLGAPCETTGHPPQCQEPVSGSTEDGDDETSVTINGTPVMTRGDLMKFGSHAHTYVEPTEEEPGGCEGFSSHNITPTETHSLTINGKSIVHVGDSGSDPGSGGTASILDSGGNTAVTHTE